MVDFPGLVLSCRALAGGGFPASQASCFPAESGPPVCQLAWAAVSPRPASSFESYRVVFSGIVGGVHFGQGVLGPGLFCRVRQLRE